ncbi:hypothetical protein Aph02nite_24720 [Actinoplanes philippinensis]|uniref:Uncharacterized protein n=1 Tax=Actinoplanes philippinensis TaxID=35752 RepID=A0A1I2G3W5_9ACTN|nr:hypothetical protein [Actinoplanes philippinensis]GIE76522.1 hypothetical protein Aph02nite_24720 [Actinoplanes philippinensis]SFF11321.1 hypothetical protein SAMN05421541_106131 [Actinoplanes philippinensis]
MEDNDLAGVRTVVSALGEAFGRCADSMSRPTTTDLDRCRALCEKLRAMPIADDRVVSLVGQLETCLHGQDPAWSTVSAIALLLGDLDATLRPT